MVSNGKKPKNKKICKVGGIPDCLHVPLLEKDLLSVPHMDVAMGWRTTFENRKCMIEDSTNACVKYDLAMMLFILPVEQVVGSNFDTHAVEI